MDDSSTFVSDPGEQTTKTIYGCSGCSIMASFNDNTKHTSRLARHLEEANSNAFLYYRCPACNETACTRKTLLEHFDFDQCKPFLEMKEKKGGDNWEITKQMFEWTRNDKLAVEMVIWDKKHMEELPGTIQGLIDRKTHLYKEDKIGGKEVGGSESSTANKAVSIVGAEWVKGSSDEATTPGRLKRKRRWD